MLVRTFGSSLDGISGVRVRVEVDAGRGLPSFQIVGQPDRIVNESRDRIRAAFRALGLEFPPGRVTVNLAPSGLPKSGSALDLPIALAVALSRLEHEPGALDDTLLVGELGLDGRLHGVSGALALLGAAEPRARGGGTALGRAVVPRENLAEAAVHPGLEVRAADRLDQVVAFALGNETLEAPASGDADLPCPEEADLGDVRGQESARRALEVAASGGHNLLMVGPPGSGKTLLARRLPGLLPDLDFEQALVATRVHSVGGTLGGRALLRRPPLRAPHHTTSDAGMIGGGRPLRPGEVSLAHGGVLFLDELAEFRRPVLEALRQPLEEGEVRIVRAHGAVSLPARFQLVAAMNPCPCGWRGDAARECSCDDPLVRRYRARLSGPLLDRIDLQVAVPSLPWKEMAADSRASESSRAVRTRVERAREVQRRRYAGSPWQLNAELPPRGIRQHCRVDEESSALLERATRALGLSMRSYQRALRVARTLADLDASRDLRIAHVAEALSYRTLERTDSGH